MGATGYDATRAALDEAAQWKPARPGDAPGEMVPGDPLTTGADFYVDDEPLEDLLAAWDRAKPVGE